MTLLADLAPGALVGMDTSPFIYFLEAHPAYGPVVKPLLADRLAQGVNRGVTSMITLAEVLVQPLRQQRIDLADKYRTLLLGNEHLVIAEIGAML